MKKTLVSVSLFLVTFVAYSQEKGEGSANKVKAGFGVTVVQEQAEFPGGTDSLIAFLNTNLVYPEKAKTERTAGKVYVSFAISDSGAILKPRVISSVSPELDSEALRVINLMPKWKPGTASGHPVKVQYVLPIEFIIPGNKQ